MSGVIFNGNSRYATDFQSVIERSVAIASLPLQQLQVTKSDLTSQQTALVSLDAKFVALQDSIDALGQASGASSFAAVSSDPDNVRARAGAGVRAGSYTIEVLDLGAQTSTMSADGLPVVADPEFANISGATSFTLSVNGTDYTVSPAAPSLSSLVDAINAIAGAEVQATIVNVGNSTAPDYRLSIAGTKYRADTITLNDGTADLLTTLSTGSNAMYKVNGSASVIQNDTRTITLSPGLQVDLLHETPGAPVTISVARDSEALEEALTAFIDAYNASVDELDTQRGENAGPLAGQSVISSLERALRSIATTSVGTGSITTLTQFGIVLDRYGHLSMDSAAFQSAVQDSPADAFAFLGSPSGGGFLGAAASLLLGVEDPLTGVLKDALETVQADLKSQDELIAESQSRIDFLREGLEQKMAVADALIASLEQQVNYFTGLFEAMRTNRENG